MSDLHGSNEFLPGDARVARPSRPSFVLAWSYDPVSDQVHLRAGGGAACAMIVAVVALTIGTAAYLQSVARELPLFAAGVEGVEAGGPFGSSAARTPGTNYLVVSTYQKYDDAVAARDKLAAAGIECVVEKDLPGWTAKPGYYSVVGVRGFATLRGSPEYQQYLAALRAAGHKPAVYKWRGDGAGAQVATVAD